MLAPSRDFEVAVLETFDAVKALVKSTFGSSAQVLPFGSFVQGAHLQDSDLDVCIDLPKRSLEGAAQQEVLRKLLGHCGSAPWRVVEARLQKSVKVPIIIVRYTTSDIEVEVDISVGLQCQNLRKDFTDRLVRAVLEDRPMVVDLLRLVKTWARLERLHKAWDGFISSLGWTLIVLFFCIQTKKLDEHRRWSKDSVGFLLAMLAVPEPRRKCNQALIQQHLLEFFVWLSETAKICARGTGKADCALAMSLVEGKLIEVPTDGGAPPIFVEDPGARVFKSTSENVARSARASCWDVVLQRAQAAQQRLRAQERGPACLDSWLAQLPRPAPAPSPEAPQAPGAAAPKAAGKRPAAFGAPRNVRPRVACKWFMIGQCWDGANCP
ncbi:unnamed protein product, partial [Effrenium voratum]